MQRLLVWTGAVLIVAGSALWLLADAWEGKWLLVGSVLPLLFAISMGRDDRRTDGQPPDVDPMTGDIASGGDWGF